MAPFQPTFADIRTQVVQKLRLDNVDLPLADYWIQQAYLDVATYTGFDWDRINVYGLVTNSGGITLPQIGWLRFLRMIYADGSRSLPAQLIRAETVLYKQTNDLNSAGQNDIVLYAMSGQNAISFWPLAQAGQAAEITHSVLPDELADEDTPCVAEPFGSKLLEYGALVEGAKFKKDPLMSDFELTYAMWMDRYTAFLAKRQGGVSMAFEVWPGGQQIDRLEAESEHWR